MSGDRMRRREVLAGLAVMGLSSKSVAGTPTLPPGRVRPGEPGWADGDAWVSARALRLMHGSPAKAWTVRDLAAQSGLSRTAFATRFSATVGIGPATYLANWRMNLAERELRATSRPISSIAHSIGFASASAFGAAFRSKFGVAPKLYRRKADSRRALEPQPTASDES